MMKAPSLQNIDTHERSVYAAWEVSAGHIIQMSEGSDASGNVAIEALLLLQLLPFFHWACITEEIFRRAHDRLKMAESSMGLSGIHLVLQIENDNWDSFRFREAMGLLGSFSLIWKDRSPMQSLVFSMHPLVHAWARDRLAAKAVAEFHALAIAVLGFAITESPSLGDLTFHREMEPHIDTAFSFQRGKQSASRYYELRSELRVTELDEIRINARVAQVYQELSRAKDAKIIYETVTERLSVLRGPSDRETLRELANLSTVKLELAENQEAYVLFRKLYDTRLKKYGQSDIETFSSMISLAEAEACNGYMLRARDQLVSLLCLIDHTEVQGVEIDPNLRTTCLDKLAFIDLHVGSRHVRSEYDAQDQISRIMGSRMIYPVSIISLSNFAIAFTAQGRHREAKSTWEKAYQEGARVLGANHPVTRHAYHQLQHSFRFDHRSVWLGFSASQAIAIAKGGVASLGDDDPRSLVIKLHNILRIPCGSSQEEFVERILKMEQILDSFHGRQQHPMVLFARVAIAHSYTHFRVVPSMDRQMANGYGKKAIKTGRALREQYLKALGELDNVSVFAGEGLLQSLVNEGEYLEAANLLADIIRVYLIKLGRKSGKVKGCLSALFDILRELGKTDQAVQKLVNSAAEDSLRGFSDARASRDNQILMLDVWNFLRATEKRQKPIEGSLNRVKELNKLHGLAHSQTTSAMWDLGDQLYPNDSPSRTHLDWCPTWKAQIERARLLYDQLLALDIDEFGKDADITESTRKKLIETSYVVGRTEDALFLYAQTVARHVKSTKDYSYVLYKFPRLEEMARELEVENDIKVIASQNAISRVAHAVVLMGVKLTLYISSGFIWEDWIDSNVDKSDPLKTTRLIFRDAEQSAFITKSKALYRSLEYRVIGSRWRWPFWKAKGD